LLVLDDRPGEATLKKLLFQVTRTDEWSPRKSSTAQGQ
jgi:hypothetical protein